MVKTSQALPYSSSSRGKFFLTFHTRTAIHKRNYHQRHTQKNGNKTCKSPRPRPRPRLKDHVYLFG